MDFFKMYVILVLISKKLKLYVKNLEQLKVNMLQLFLLVKLIVLLISFIPFHVLEPKQMQLHAVLVQP